MILQIFVLKSKNMIYFQPLEVVGRGSEKQLHVAEKNKKISLAGEGSKIKRGINQQDFIIVDLHIVKSEIE